MVRLADVDYPKEYEDPALFLNTSGMCGQHKIFGVCGTATEYLHEAIMIVGKSPTRSH